MTPENEAYLAKIRKQRADALIIADAWNAKNPNYELWFLRFDSCGPTYGRITHRDGTIICQDESDNDVELVNTLISIMD